VIFSLLPSGIPVGKQNQPCCSGCNRLQMILLGTPNAPVRPFCRETILPLGFPATARLAAIHKPTDSFPSFQRKSGLVCYFYVRGQSSDLNLSARGEGSLFSPPATKERRETRQVAGVLPSVGTSLAHELILLWGIVPFGFALKTNRYTTKGISSM
jgi:hypothetical protein